MRVGFAPGTGVFHRAHPFTTVAFAVAASLAAFALPGPWGVLVVLGAVALVVTVARVPRVFLPALVIAGPFWLFLLVIHGLLGDDPARAITIAARVTTMVLAFLLLTTTVHPERLVEALVARRWPFAVAYLLSATLQSLPRLRARADAILAAQRCRGLRVHGSLVARARALVPLAVPLVLGVLAESEERAFALEARAGRGAVRTPLDPPPDSLVQRALRWLLVLGAVGAVVFRAVA